MGTITVTITLWDEGKADSLIAKIGHDSRVVSVERIDV